MVIKQRASSIASTSSRKSISVGKGSTYARVTRATPLNLRISSSGHTWNMEDLKSVVTFSPTLQPVEPDPRSRNMGENYILWAYFKFYSTWSRVARLVMTPSHTHTHTHIHTHTYTHTHTHSYYAYKQGLKIRYNITYIVVGVALEDGKVLMMQEAKPSCRGSWYLPAGRMEENETIVVSLHG